MRLGLLYVLGVCLMFCTGCNVGPDYKTPASPTPKRYTKESNLLTAEQHIAIGKKLQTEWWTLFACESLDKVIQQALRDNYELAAAKKALSQAEESINVKSGSLWPQIGLTGIAGRQKYGVALFGPTTFRIPTFTYYELGPTGTWQIDFFGITRYSIRQQEALAQYQAHQLDAVYITLTSNIVAQALEIAALNAEITATSKIIAEDEKTLQLVYKKFIVGSANRLNIIEVQTQLEHDRAALPALKQRLDIAQHALAALVGKVPANWSPPNFTLDDFTLPKELPVSLPSEMVRQRPDILAAEANLQAASAAVGLATANMYPNIVLSGNALLQSLIPSKLFNTEGAGWGIAGTLTAPLFNGGTLRAEKRKAEYAYDATVAEYQQIILTAFEQVADALTALSHDAEEVNISQQYLATANTSLGLAYKSFDAGAIGLMQIQDSERNYAQAQIILIHAQRQRYLDTAKLFMALGGSPISKRCYTNS